MGYFSNGTEGAIFEEEWCSRCVHSDISGDREIGVDPPCPVMMMHQLWAYELCNEDPQEHAAKMMLDSLIVQREVAAGDGVRLFVNECAMFHPIDDGAAIPGQMRIGEVVA